MRRSLILPAVVAAALAATQLRPQVPDSVALADQEQVLRAELARQPSDPVARYNLGTVLVLQERYDEARPHLMDAAAADEGPRGAASYNLGATDLEPAFRDPELEGREDRLRRAIEAYKAALLEDPTDEDAKWNLELARRLLERDQETSGGGGGGGGGGQAQPMPGSGDPSPTRAAGGGAQPEVSETPAEALLRSAREQELEVQRERLRKPQPPGPMRP